MVMPPAAQEERPWWERQDVAQIAQDDGLDPLDLGTPPSADLYAPRQEPPQPAFKPIEPDYRWDMPAVLAQLRREIPAVPRSAGLFERMAGTAFDIVGEPVGGIIDVLSWPAETTERIAGMFYFNNIPLGDRWEMGKLTWESFGFGIKSQREEILNRYRAGDDPGKIEADYSDDWSNILGQLIADPLNLMGVPGLGLLAKATRVEKGSRIYKTLNRLNKGLVLPRFNLKEVAAADLLSGIKGARPAANALTRSLRELDFGQTADERIVDRVIQNFGEIRNWGVDSGAARRVVDDWRLRGTNVPYYSVRMIGAARAGEGKQAGRELLARLAMNPLVSHDDILRYQDEIIAGAWEGDLVRNFPQWLAPGTKKDSAKPDWWQRIRDDVHPNPPQGLMVMDAAAAEARGLQRTADQVFKHSRRRGWFEGTLEEYKALSPSEQRALFPNREQWAAKFMDEWIKFAEGDGKVGGALDHYFGIGADVVRSADNQLIVVPRELTDIERWDRKVQAAQGHMKAALGIAFLNKPSYLIGNAVTNLSFGLSRIGDGVWRNSLEDEARIGTDLLRSYTYDLGRSSYQAIKEAPEGPVSMKAAIKSSLLTWRPFSNLANKAPYFADVDMRRRLSIETYHNVFGVNFVPSDLSPFGILKPIRWAEGTTTDEKRAMISVLGNIRNEAELDGKIAELADGTLSLDHAGYLLQRVLESEGLDQTRALYFRNLLGEKHHRELGAALARSTSPAEARHMVDTIAGDIHKLSYDFMGDVPLPIYRAERANLREMRAQNSVIIRRWFKGLHAAGQRKMDLHGIRDDRFEGALFGLTKKLEEGQVTMFNRLDNELSPYNAANDLTTAAGRKAYRDARNAIAKEYDDLEAAAWKQADEALKPVLTKPELRTWWADMRKRHAVARQAVRKRRAEVFTALGDDWVYLDDAAPQWRDYHAFRDATYQKVLDDSYKQLRMTPLPDEMEPITEEGLDIAHSTMRYKDETADYLRKMADHVDELFEPVRRETIDGVEQVVEWAPKRFVIEPERAAELRRYLDEDVRPDLRVMQTVALRAGRAMADDALLSYDAKYGLDKPFTYLAPYGFWPSRMAHRWVKAAQARPGAAAAFAKLIDAQRRIQDDLPERLRGKLRIPVPFMPDWMGDNLYFDPIRYFFPPAQGIGQELEGETVQGTIYNWAQTVGAMPSPIVSVPLQMTGILGERDSYIRNFMSGGPWLLPGTAGQRAIYGFLRGAPATEWGDDLQPEDWDHIMLGDALPEPRIREILGLPPGEQWDGYRVLRALASGAADGSWAAEDAVRAMQARAGPIWERGKERAESEAGIRELSTWLGLPASIYPKGEALQNGLQAMYAVARDMDRVSGKDEMIDSFYSAFPEFQARSIQKAWYRGRQSVEAEADTAAFYLDLGQIKDKYDPQIEYLSQVRDAMPPVAKASWTKQINALYAERQQASDALDKKYPRRRTAPSLSAPPHERALAYLREAYYKIKGDSFGSEKAAREMFVSRLTGRGQADNYYRLTMRRDELFAQFDQRLAGASNVDRDTIYEERKRALEALTQQAIPEISRQDFEDYLAKSKREPDEERSERQRVSDLLATLFSSSDAQRVLREHPEIARQYGTAADSQAAGQIDTWYNWYDALPPNSRARDDYVESYLPDLNDARMRLGLPPLEARPRPTAGPIVIGNDPYEQALAAVEAELVRQ